VTLRLIDLSEREDFAYLTFAAVHDDVPVHHEEVRVTISLHSGALTGLQADRFYRYFQQERTIPKPLISVGEAKPKNVEAAADEGPALIYGRNKQEALVYVFKVDGPSWKRIYIHAQTGKEELIRLEGGWEF
jgi:hypothetical protein